MALLEILLTSILVIVIGIIIIYYAPKLIGKKDGLGTAILSAIIYAGIFILLYYFIGLWNFTILVGVIIVIIILISLVRTLLSKKKMIKKEIEEINTTEESIDPKKFKETNYGISEESGITKETLMFRY